MTREEAMTPDERHALYIELEPAVFPDATPAAIAADLDVSDQTVRNWRKGTSPVPLPVLWHLAARRVMGDPRPFAEVLGDWLQRRGASYYAAARLLEVDDRSPANWSKGRPCGQEKAMRALMGQIDAEAIR